MQKMNKKISIQAGIYLVEGRDDINYRQHGILGIEYYNKLWGWIDLGHVQWRDEPDKVIGLLDLRKPKECMEAGLC